MRLATYVRGGFSDQDVWIGALVGLLHRFGLAAAPAAAIQDVVRQAGRLDPAAMDEAVAIVLAEGA